eukprot:4889867-Prymnesium_polylepis.1
MHLQAQACADGAKDAEGGGSHRGAERLVVIDAGHLWVHPWTQIRDLWRPSRLTLYAHVNLTMRRPRGRALRSMYAQD